jgi:hypothetical protein
MSVVGAKRTSQRPKCTSANDPKRTSLGNCVKAKDALPIVLHADDNAAITAAFREGLWTRAEIMVFSSGWTHRSSEPRLVRSIDTPLSAIPCVEIENALARGTEGYQHGPGHAPEGRFNVRFRTLGNQPFRVPV